MVIDKEQKEFIPDAPAQFVNHVVIGSNPDEIVFQFGQTAPDNPERPLPIARIVMTRSQAIRLLNSLIETVSPQQVGDAAADIASSAGIFKDDPLWNEIKTKLRHFREPQDVE